jgi:putative membrane protein (TIGR04086 family)
MPTTERLRNLRPSWIAFGWFIGAAVTSLLILAFVAFGLLPPAGVLNGGIWIPLALLLGFFCGGFFVGWRARAAPVLHGLAIGLFSLIVYVLANLLFGEPTGWAAWGGLPTGEAAMLLLLLTVAAAIGGRVGMRWAM